MFALPMKRRFAALIGIAVLGLVASGCAPAFDSASHGKTKTVWYADVVDSNPIANAIAQVINDALSKDGISMVRSLAVDPTTGSIDVSVQSQALTRAVASSPDAIAYFVLDPAASKPQIEQAKSAGIPVFASFGKPAFDVSAYMTINDQMTGYVAAKFLADHLPHGAKVAVISGAPAPNVLDEEKGAMKALQEAGVTVVGAVEQQRNLTDNADGGKKIMQGILERYPDVQGVFVYNDDSALGAIAAAKQAGANVKFVSRNGTADAVQAVKAGDLLATCDVKPVQLGQALGQAIAQQLGGSRTYSGNAQIAMPDPANCLVTKDNAGDWKPAEKQVQFRTIPMG